MEGGIDIGLDRRSLIGGLAGLAAAPLFAEDSPPGSAPAKRRVSAVTACPVPAVEMRVPTMGGNLYARGNGPLGDGPAPVLFLHGGPGGSHLGMVGALPLADTRGVILYDQLDCGLSDRPGDRSGWNVDRFVSEIDSMRRAFNLDRFHLSGTSWGGTLALEYAARRPEGLESPLKGVWRACVVYHGHISLPLVYAHHTAFYARKGAQTFLYLAFSQAKLAAYDHGSQGILHIEFSRDTDSDVIGIFARHRGEPARIAAEYDIPGCHVALLQPVAGAMRRGSGEEFGRRVFGVDHAEFQPMLGC